MEKSTHISINRKEKNKMEEIIETTENEVMDVITDSDIVEEVAEQTTGTALKVATGIGIGLVAGAALYKFVVTPLIAKIKARKAAKSEEAETNDVVIEEVEEPSDEADDE